ncbi:hypothetical protein SARC_10207, partial [Sphaeroforma arctica JP610]
MRAQLDDRLRTLGIELRVHTHKAAPTCTVHEAELANWDIKGVPLVNLFVRAKKNQQLFLICTPAERKVSLMSFQRDIMKYSRANMIRFAPEETMYPTLKGCQLRERGTEHIALARATEYKVHPGCATPLAAMFADEKLTVVIDKAIMDSEQLVMVHPL